MMSRENKQLYRTRMAVAELFRSFLNDNGEREKLISRLNVDSVPVIIPALGDTLSSSIKEAAQRHFNNGEKYVIVPVWLPMKEKDSFTLCVLILSAQDITETLWKIDMNELHDNVTMSCIVEALDSNKKWDLQKLDTHKQQELTKMTCST